MSKGREYEVPPELKEAQQQFEQWRSLHSGRRIIPEQLWELAAGVAREHGVFRTAQVLRLDYTRLKQRLACTVPEAKVETGPAPAAFVEFIAPQAAQTCQCVVELEGPRGKMRIEWKGTTPPDLCGLSRALWEPGV